MPDGERMFSAISAYVTKLGHLAIDNDLQAGTMTVVFKSHVPVDGPLVTLKIHGTRNVEISLGAPPDGKSFRRLAKVYADALALIDCFHLIDVDAIDPDESQSGRGLRIAGKMSR
jgi:hypothetical protein